jgi:hypothetical protein
MKKAEKQPKRIAFPALPLGHVGNIVIWEGNYRSDILNIGCPREFFTNKLNFFLPHKILMEAGGRPELFVFRNSQIHRKGDFIVFPLL